ncbi:tyrosine-type recombinase/integrase [Amycolatopsis sp. NPDC047767]|uniref:tyrosine-type recombinase/integrase n=1 Tax=Amycolatopsis sp. NPDC047767 TaxID=3156765 RepID=UPI00345344B7
MARLAVGGGRLMGFVNRTDAGKWKAFWREPSGKQRSKTFATKREASAFLAQVETSKSGGMYVSPHAGRTLFEDHAHAWMASWNNEATTVARDTSIMRTHVLPQWGSWQLAKIDHLSVQAWVTELTGKLARSTVAECKRLTSGVLRSAVRNRLIGHNPAEDVKVPGRRVHDTDDKIVTRRQVRDLILPATPDRYRALVATAAFSGLRWGEVIALCMDAVDLDAGNVRVIRTVIEVAGSTSFKPYPKSRAGRRTVPLPAWVVSELRAHLERYPVEGPARMLFTNEAGGALRRTLFRARVWRPTLVRAGLLGNLEHAGDRFKATWTGRDGMAHAALWERERDAVAEIARYHHGGASFHDLRHSYGTWLADDGVPVNKVQRVMGHENVTTTLKFYVRKTEDHEAILGALGDDDPDDDGGALAAV